MLFSTITAAASLLVCALATPVAIANAGAEPHPSPLAKRATEAIHLINCGANSFLDYCDNDSNCNFSPASSNRCTPHAGINVWEGSAQSCTFSTGVTFSWNIEKNAQDQPNFSKVGTGSNGFRNFNIFKDDKHPMFTENGFGCDSIYYCLDA